MPEGQSNLLTYFRDFLIEDWFASIPIFISFVLLVAVIIERSIYYSRNQRNLPKFIRQIQSELEQDNIDKALQIARQTGGLLGLITEEAIRLIRIRTDNFSNSFDISASLYIRDLEKRLPLLSTIGATCPFLGLFGTVIGVIVTLKLMGEGAGQSAAVVTGVAKALIATGAGLIVAIAAVVMNNYFASIVTQFENDFQIIKLTFLDFIQSKKISGNSVKQAPQQPQATVQQPNLGESSGMPPQPNLPYNNN